MTNERILAFARMTRKEDGDGKAGKANAKMPGQAGHDSGRGWDDNAGREGYSSPCSKRGLSYRHKSCFCQSSGKPIAFSRPLGKIASNASKRSLTEEFTDILCSR